MKKEFAQYVENIYKLEALKKDINEVSKRYDYLKNAIEQLEAHKAPEVTIDFIAREANRVARSIYKLQLEQNKIEREQIEFNLKELSEE